MDYILAREESEPDRFEQLQKRANSVQTPDRCSEESVACIVELRALVLEALSLARTETEYKQLAQENKRLNNRLNSAKREINELLTIKTDYTMQVRRAEQAESEAKRVEREAMEIRDACDDLIGSQIQTIETLLLTDSENRDTIKALAAKAQAVGSKPAPTGPVDRALLQAKRDSIRAKARVAFIGVFVLGLGLMVIFLSLWIWTH
jgi:ABC-type transport system involved in cytochrome bd biosynthesis fused ATPase/permease subunit